MRVQTGLTPPPADDDSTLLDLSLNSIDQLLESVSVGSSLDIAALVEVARAAPKQVDAPAILVVAAHPREEILVRRALAVLWPAAGVREACIAVGNIYDDVRRTFGTAAGAEDFCALQLRRRIDSPARCQAVKAALGRNIAVVVGAQCEQVLSKLPPHAPRVTISMDETLPMAVHAYINPQATPLAVAHMLLPHLQTLWGAPIGGDS